MGKIDKGDTSKEQVQLQRRAAIECLSFVDRKVNHDVCRHQILNRVRDITSRYPCLSALDKLGEKADEGGVFSLDEGWLHTANEDDAVQEAIVEEKPKASPKRAPDHLRKT